MLGFFKNYRITEVDRPLWLEEVEASRISSQSAYEGSKVVSPTHRSPLPARIYTLYSFPLKAESIPATQCVWKE